MREIKFRVWDGIMKKMDYNPEKLTIGDCYDGIGTVDINDVFLEGNWMEYIGLKDSKRTAEYPKGQEIYEGDILKIIFKSGTEIAPVSWGSYDDGEYVSNIECWMADDHPISDKGGLWGSSHHTYEVIGNLFENPELLKRT